MNRTSHKAKRCNAVLGVLLGLLVTVSGAQLAHADRVRDLSAVLEKDNSEKTRIAAAVSLGQLKSPAALKPLVKALRDDSKVVRSVACVALAKLGDARALPALQRASRDSDKSVRKRAVEAIGRIRNSGREASNKKFKVKTRKVREAHYRLDGRESPRIPVKPQLLVTIQSSVAKAPGLSGNSKFRKKLRRDSADALRRLMHAELSASKRITTSTQLAGDLKLPTYSVDLSITQMRRRMRGPFVEIECELRVAISDGRGRMMSFVTGGAKVQVPKKSYRRSLESNMRREALENAVKSVHTDLLRYLASNTGV